MRKVVIILFIFVVCLQCHLAASKKKQEEEKMKKKIEREIRDKEKAEKLKEELEEVRIRASKRKVHESPGKRKIIEHLDSVVAKLHSGDDDDYTPIDSTAGLHDLNDLAEVKDEVERMRREAMGGGGGGGGDDDDKYEAWLRGERKVLEDEDFRIVVDFRPDECDVFAEANDTVDIHYVARVGDEHGDIFDSSRMPHPDTGLAFPYKIKLSKILAEGWEEGIIGMCVGEKRSVYIPPEKGFGRFGLSSVMGHVPPNEMVFFELELLGVEKFDGSEEDQLMQRTEAFFNKLDVDRDGKITKEEYFDHLMGGYSSDPDLLSRPDEMKRVRRDTIKMVRDIFRAEDINGDGHITYQEQLDVKMRQLKGGGRQKGAGGQGGPAAHMPRMEL